MVLRIITQAKDMDRRAEAVNKLCIPVPTQKFWLANLMHWKHRLQQANRHRILKMRL